MNHKEYYSKYNLGKYRSYKIIGNVYDMEYNKYSGESFEKQIFFDEAIKTIPNLACPCEYWVDIKYELGWERYLCWNMSTEYAKKLKNIDFLYEETISEKSRLRLIQPNRLYLRGYYNGISS